MRCNIAFTLIELLIVVAIISVLAAIAVPNFMEARSRAKISRVRADHRMMRLALEAYHVDAQAYPSAESNGTLKWLRWMTTPVPYMRTTKLEDPFSAGAESRDLATLRSYRNYRYYGFNEMGLLNADKETGELIPVYATPGTMWVFCYVLFSHGPDKIRTIGAGGGTFVQSENLFYPEKFIDFIYDPTNGTVSDGEILDAGGNVMGRAEGSIRLITRR